MDEALQDNPIALNLLYIETINDIKKGIIEVLDDVADDLANYRSVYRAWMYIDPFNPMRSLNCVQPCVASVPRSFPAPVC